MNTFDILVYVSYKEPLNKSKFSNYQMVEDFGKEIKCLENHNYIIENIDFELFTVILKIKLKMDRPEDIKKNYKKIDLVPYLTHRPFQAIAEKRGKDWKITNLVIS